MNILTHIRSQIKIIIRYSDLLIGSILVYISTGILLVLLSRSYHFNIPLLCVAFGIFSTGALFGNLFCEKPNEIRGYMLAPWSLRSVILSKNTTVSFLSAIFPLPIIFAASFFVTSSVQDYINAVLYFITSIPICLFLGNIISVSQRILASSQQVTSLLQWGIAVASPLPYMIFKGWMNSVILCISFLSLSCIMWYVYQLPWVEERFRTVFCKIS